MGNVSHKANKAAQYLVYVPQCLDNKFFGSYVAVEMFFAKTNLFYQYDVLHFDVESKSILSLEFYDLSMFMEA